MIYLVYTYKNDDFCPIPKLVIAFQSQNIKVIRYICMDEVEMIPAVLPEGGNDNSPG